MALCSSVPGARQRTWHFTLQRILGFEVLHVLLLGRTWFQLSMRDCCVQHVKKEGGICVWTLVTSPIAFAS